MCLLLFAWDCHPRYRLVLAGNRDEFHARPARAASWWNERPGLLAGRDEQAGGTWLGIARSGRVAVVTNYREMQRPVPGARSRGELVTGFVCDDGSTDDFEAALRARADAYGGFNLLFADLGAATPVLHYATNRGVADTPVAPGVHGLSNHLLDTPWPKVKLGKTRFAELVRPDEVPIESLFALLGDRRRAGDDQLPDTGLDTPTEKMLSAPFIVSPRYGTRCSTVLCVTRDGTAEFAERRFAPDGSVTGETRECFTLAPTT